MNVLLVDSNSMLRSEVGSLLRDLGFSVHPFADPHFAFLYLLGKQDEIDAVAVNSDDGDGFLQRIEVLGPMAAVTYSDSDLDGGAEIAFQLSPKDEAFADCGRLGSE
jgi:DNA-binding response OmpR family regulator